MVRGGGGGGGECHSQADTTKCFDVTDDDDYRLQRTADFLAATSLRT